MSSSSIYQNKNKIYNKSKLRKWPKGFVIKVKTKKRKKVWSGLKIREKVSSIAQNGNEIIPKSGP